MDIGLPWIISWFERRVAIYLNGERVYLWFGAVSLMPIIK